VSDGNTDVDGAAEVTVVVATRNRWPQLQQTLPRHGPRVVLVDNGSDDGTADQVSRRFPHVDVVRLDRNRGAVARNVGVARSRTPIVAFADDDSWWAPGALRRAAAQFDRCPRLAVVAARVLVGPDQRLDPVSAQMASSPLRTSDSSGWPPVLGFVACGAVVRRRAFLEVGGFDDVVFFLGEEERLALDLVTAGWDLRYVAEVVARHVPQPDDGRRGRRVLERRNRLLTAVMRRPLPRVAEQAWSLAREGRDGRAAIRAAAPRLPQALRRRRVVPSWVEAQRRALG
jgi:GT2 family glycosyltransferase